MRQLPPEEQQQFSLPLPRFEDCHRVAPYVKFSEGFSPRTRPGERFLSSYRRVSWSAQIRAEPLWRASGAPSAGGEIPLLPASALPKALSAER